MSFGYNMLFPRIIFLAFGLNEKNKIFTVVGAIGIVELLLGGSRAALLSVIVFLGLYWIVFYFSKLSYKQKALSLVLLVIAACAVLFFYNPILNGIASLLNQLGIDSRNLDKLLSASMTDDMNRALLYEKSGALISSGGLFGHGIYADRLSLGNYCHNIFLELFIDFGYFGGPLVAVYIGIVIYRSLFKYKDSNWKMIFLIMISSCFTRLLVSYSLWLDVKLWIAFAIYMNMKKERMQNSRIQR